MAQSDTWPGDATDWTTFAEAMNRSMVEAVQDNAAMQTRFVEAWFDAVDDAWTAPAQMDDWNEGYARASEAWLQAAEEHTEQVIRMLEGQEVAPEDFRDIWLHTANKAFKEVMRTSAFAAATGETVSNGLEFQQQIDEVTEETLHSLGFATEGDVVEVGARLVEMERRQHAVEQKLDRVLEALETGEAP